MRLVVSDKILKLTSLLVVILWLSPTLIEFTVNLGSQTYSWSAFVLLFLLPIIGFIYLILAVLIKKMVAFLVWSSLYFFPLLSLWHWVLTCSVLKRKFNLYYFSINRWQRKAFVVM